MSDSNIIASLLGALAAVWIFVFILAVLRIVGRWKMFEKAGIAGWHSIIPILNTYDWFIMSGFEKGWALAGVFGEAFALLLCAVSGGSDSASAFSGFLFMAAVILAGVMELMSFFMIASRFGKGAGTGFLFMFFGDVMCMVAGFSSSWTYTPKAAKIGTGNLKNGE